MKKLLIATAMGVILLSPFSASAVFVIDNMNSGVTAVVSPGGPVNDTAIGNPGDILGDYRRTTVTRTAGSLSVRGNANPPGGSMGFSSDTDATGNFQLAYGGATGFSFGQTDITVGGTAFGTFMKFSNIDAACTVTMFVTTPTGNGSLNLPKAVAGDLFFPYTSFSGTPDFTKVTKIQFTLFGTSDGDYTIDFIDVRDQPPGVPDVGGTMMLLSIGVGLLGVARWKMNA